MTSLEMTIWHPFPFHNPIDSEFDSEGEVLAHSAADLNHETHHSENHNTSPV